MRVIFCGNPAFALPTLRALLNSRHDVAAVVTSPDKPRGRGQGLSSLPVKKHAIVSGLPILQPQKLRDEDFLTTIRRIEPDAIVVVAFRILPRELFALPRLGSFNVHPSLLPRGRGPAPIPWTLIRGEQETGATIIRLTEQIDGGDILAQERIPVLPSDDFGSLHDKLADIGARILINVLDAFDRGDPPHPIPQDESNVTKAPKLFAQDYELDWDMPAENLANRIRALSPMPGAVALADNRRTKILAAEVVENLHHLEPGELRPDDANGLVVGTGDGALRLIRVQPEGRRAMTVLEYLRGRPQLPNKFDK